MLHQKTKGTIMSHRPKAKLSYSIQPEELQDILNKYTQEQKTNSRGIPRKKEKKKKYCLAGTIISIPRSLYQG
jgi:exopolyphosphatase/pppGpp-phosphohydrolase